MTTPALAAEVWAPGVSQAGGWVDTNKSRVDSGMWADTSMCWAASASNVISWWSKWNSATLTLATSASVAAHKDPWTVFRAVYENEGINPTYGLTWWIGGIYDDFGNITQPSHYDATNFPTYIDPETSKPYAWEYGAFLNGNKYDTLAKRLYDTEAHPVEVASNPNNTDGRALSLSIIETMSAGYALSLSVYNDAGNAGVAHAVTLWGLEYEGEGDDRIITRMWITDSDDSTTTGQLVEYAMDNSKPTCLAFKGLDTNGDGIYGEAGLLNSATIGYVAGMWVDPNLVPEPATAALSLLGMAALAARRRRS